MMWIQENYPKIAGELNRVTEMTYADPVTGLKVNNYDPLLQTLGFSNLKRVFANQYEVKRFEDNLDNGIGRLRAYLGYITS